MKTLTGLTMILCAISFGRAEEVILEDFDGTAHGRVNWMQTPEKADHDGDGDMEGKVTASGFQAVMKYNVPRQGAVAWLESAPILTGTVAVDRSENQVNFISVLAIVQTDATSATVYDPLKDLSHSPFRKGNGPFSFPLKGAVTNKGTPLVDLLAAFESGQGKFLNLVLVQQSPKGETSKVVYDDLKLTTAVGTVEKAEEASPSYN